MRVKEGKERKKRQRAVGEGEEGRDEKEGKIKKKTQERGKTDA